MSKLFCVLIVCRSFRYKTILMEDRKLDGKNPPEWKPELKYDFGKQDLPLFLYE